MQVTTFLISEKAKMRRDGGHPQGKGMVTTCPKDRNVVGCKFKGGRKREGHGGREGEKKPEGGGALQTTSQIRRSIVLW